MNTIKEIDWTLPLKRFNKAINEYIADFFNLKSN